MSTDPRQHWPAWRFGDSERPSAHKVLRQEMRRCWQAEQAGADATQLLAALADAGYVVVYCPEGEARLVRHEDGTTTSSPVRPSASIDRSCSECWAKACDGPKPEPCPTGACQEPIAMWREVPG